MGTAERPYLNSNLVIDTLLFVFYLLLNSLQRCRIRCCSIGLEDLDVPKSRQRILMKLQVSTDSSVNGVIFFSGSSSSAKVF